MLNSILRLGLIFVYFTLGLVVVEVVVEDEFVDMVVEDKDVIDELEGIKAGEVSAVGAFSELDNSGGALLTSGIVDSASKVVNSSVSFDSAILVVGSEVSVVLTEGK